MKAYEFTHYSNMASNPQLTAFTIAVMALGSFVMLGLLGFVAYSESRDAFNAIEGGWASEESIYGASIRRSGIIGLFNRSYSL